MDSSNSLCLSILLSFFRSYIFEIIFVLLDVLLTCITFMGHTYRNNNQLMRNLQLLAAIVTIGFCTCSCNTKPSNSKEVSTKNIEQTATKSVKVYDTDLIMESALNGNLETVKEALNNGFNVNTVDANKRTPLMLAAYNGHYELVKLLIENEADVNLTDAVNRTALMFASTGSFVPTVSILLQSGAKPNMIDSEEKWTAAMMAASEGQLEVLKVLVSNGADLKMVDVDGESSLDFAKSKGHKAVADYILKELK